MSVTNVERYLVDGFVILNSSSKMYLANLVDADGFIQLPPERSTFDKGEHFPYYPFRNV